MHNKRTDRAALVARGLQAQEIREGLGLSHFKTAVIASCHPNSVRLAEAGASSSAMLDRILAALENARAGR